MTAMMPVPWGTRNHWDEKFHNARDGGDDGGVLASCWFESVWTPSVRECPSVSEGLGPGSWWSSILLLNYLYVKELDLSPIVSLRRKQSCQHARTEKLRPLLGPAATSHVFNNVGIERLHVVSIYGPYIIIPSRPIGRKYADCVEERKSEVSTLRTG